MHQLAILIVLFNTVVEGSKGQSPPSVRPRRPKRPAVRAALLPFLGGWLVQWARGILRRLIGSMGPRRPAMDSKNVGNNKLLQ